MERHLKDDKISKETKDLKLIINKQKVVILTTYADTNCTVDKSVRKSTNGNLFRLDDTSILWINRKQNSVALS